MRRLLISFSGGETSAYMTQWILQNWLERYDHIAIVFANTSEENLACLDFVDHCDRLLFEPMGFKVAWIEGVMAHGARRAPEARVVTFETAARNGEVFEDYIRKYGIPNMKFKGCTRSMKRQPIEQYAKLVLGWPLNTYDLAIGIRADEIDRMRADRDQKRIVYPLVKEHPRTKPQINAWWSRQTFRLRSTGYDGNCKACWKKSFRKLMTIADQTPRAFDNFARWEDTLGHVGPEFAHDPATRREPLPEGYRRTFFRGNKGVRDIFADLERAVAAGTFRPALDDAVVYDHELDTAGACGGDETCEVWADDEEDGEE